MHERLSLRFSPREITSRMLAELRIKNFVLIDHLSLSFGAGLNLSLIHI